MLRLVLATFLWATVMVLGVWDYCVLRFPPCHLPRVYQEVLMPVVKVRANGATGSGVIIGTTPNGSGLRCRFADKHRFTQIYVLTAAHVVGNEKEVGVYIYDYEIPIVTIQSATVIITDTYKDLALLRYTSSQRYKQARLAPRDYQPCLFTEVYAVGCSLGLNPRPSEGIITVVGPDASVGISSSPRARHIEVSAPVLPGNSGGGVFLKSTHELIGIVVWVRTYHGQLVTTMCGIVPINEIYEFLRNAPVSNYIPGGVRTRTGPGRLIGPTLKKGGELTWQQ